MSVGAVSILSDTLRMVNSEFDQPTFTGIVPLAEMVSDDMYISILDLDDVRMNETFDSHPMDVESSILPSICS